MPRVLFSLLILSAICLSGTPAQADDWSDAKKAFRKAVSSKKWQERAAAYGELAFYDGKDLVPAMLKPLKKEKNPAVHLAVIRVLSQLQSEDARKALVSAAEKAKGDERYWLILSIGRLPSAHGTDFLRKELKSRDRVMAAQAALALGEKRATAGLSEILALLGDEAWQLRAAAACAIRHMRGPRHKDPKKPDPDPNGFDSEVVAKALVGALESEEAGSAKREIIRALERVTDGAYGDDPKAWRAFIEGRKDDIRPKPKHPAYVFGTPIYEDRLVFVLDNNLKLDEAHPFKEVARLQEITKMPNGPRLPYMRMATKGDMIRYSTVRIVRDLAKLKGRKMELLHVGLTTKDLFGKMQPINTGTVSRVSKELESPMRDPSHNTRDALAKAIALGGRSAKSHWRNGPDVVVYFTSSTPWVDGRAQDQDVAAAEFALEARKRMLACHLVGIGPHPQPLITGIQELCMGFYVDMER